MLEQIVQFVERVTCWLYFISSPELKAQVSFSDLSVRPSVCKLYTFSSSSPEPLGQFQPNLVFLGEEDPSLFKWRATPFPKGRQLGNNENKFTTFKNLLLQNYWANFNQTWHKVSLGEGDSSLFKWRAPSFSKGR